MSSQQSGFRSFLRGCLSFSGVPARTRVMLGLGVGAIALSPLPVQANSLTRWAYDPTANQLEVQVEQETQPRYFLMAQPARIVLDFPDTAVGEVQSHQTYDGAVRQVRVSQFQPGLTRIVLELSPDATLAPGQVKLQKVEAKSGGSRWVLRPLLVGAVTDGTAGSKPSSIPSRTEMPPPPVATTAARPADSDQPQTSDAASNGTEANPSRSASDLSAEPLMLKASPSVSPATMAVMTLRPTPAPQTDSSPAPTSEQPAIAPSLAPTSEKAGNPQSVFPAKPGGELDLAIDTRAGVVIAVPSPISPVIQPSSKPATPISPRPAPPVAMKPPVPLSATASLPVELPATLTELPIAGKPKIAVPPIGTTHPSVIGDSTPPPPSVAMPAIAAVPSLPIANRPNAPTLAQTLAGNVVVPTQDLRSPAPVPPVQPTRPSSAPVTVVAPTLPVNSNLPGKVPTLPATRVMPRSPMQAPISVPSSPPVSVPQTPAVRVPVSPADSVPQTRVPTIPGASVPPMPSQKPVAAPMVSVPPLPSQTPQVSVPSIQPQVFPQMPVSPAPMVSVPPLQPGTMPQMPMTGTPTVSVPPLQSGVYQPMPLQSGVYQPTMSTVQPTSSRVVEFGDPLPIAPTPQMSWNSLNQGSSPVVLSPGMVLNLRYVGHTPLETKSGTPQPTQLVLASDLQDGQGALLAPAGTPVIGQFESASGGSRFVTQAIALNGQAIPFSAQSEVLSGDRNPGGSDRVILSSGAGALAGGLVSGFSGWGTLGGAATGAAIGYFTLPKATTIQPGAIIPVRLK